jgi:hypothetical protein
MDIVARGFVLPEPLSRQSAVPAEPDLGSVVRLA